MSNEHRKNVQRRMQQDSPAQAGHHRLRGSSRRAAFGCVSVLLWASTGLAQTPAADPEAPAARSPASSIGKATPPAKPPASRTKEGVAPGQPKGSTPGERGKAKESPGSASAERARPGAPDPRLGKGPGVEKGNRGKHQPSRAAAAREARASALEAYREALRAAREADAQDGADATDPSARQKALEDARKKLLEAHRKGPRPRMSPKRAAARDKKLESAMEKARADREERREERLAKLKKVHGEKLEAPALRNELLRHAWRVARLERSIQIAEATSRTRLVAKAQELLEKENEKHEARLAQLAKAPAPPAAKAANTKASAKEIPKPAAKADAAPTKPAVNALAPSTAAQKGTE